jgi:FHA domain/zinc-ribbon domain
MFCTQCGHENPADSRYCARCGAPLVPVPAGGAPRSSSLDIGESPVTSTATISQVAPERGDEAADASSAYGDLTPDDQAAVDGLPAACALLVVARGPSSGSRYLLDTEIVTAGRQPDSDIFLDDVTVSRRHAEFRRIEDGFAVRDVGSLNGTYVNRDRIEDVLLSDGDEVQIGKFRLVFLTGPREPGATG